MAHKTNELSGLDAFERETIHRLLTEAARFWVIATFLKTKDLPTPATYYAYPDVVPACFDWGNPPGPEQYAPLRGKKVTITLKIEPA